MSKWMLMVLSMIYACFSFVPAQAASFNCAKASTWVERTICRSPELSKLDDALAKQYADNIEEARDNTIDHTKTTRNEQRQWLNFQRNTCRDEVCLIREYKERLGGKPDYGTVWNYSSEIKSSHLPKSSAFGTFSKLMQISVYDPDTKNNYNMYDETNSINILKVFSKPYLAVIDSQMIFNNAHICSIEDQLAKWSENHWTLTSYKRNEPAEIRLYPAIYQGETQILVRDIKGQYRHLNCGMQGYFDGMMLKKSW